MCPGIRADNSQKEMATFAGKKLIGRGLIKLEPGIVICPACGQQVEAVARNGQVKGYCAVARQYVDFLAETQLAPVRKGRDSRGRFVKGNVPWNKRRV